MNDLSEAIKLISKLETWVETGPTKPELNTSKNRWNGESTAVKVALLA